MKRYGFREWYDERRDKYQTAAEGMKITEYVEHALDDLTRAFCDYVDEVLGIDPHHPDD
jgi:hypothetical protein